MVELEILIGLLATGRMEVVLQMYLNSFANLKFPRAREVAALVLDHEMVGQQMKWLAKSRPTLPPLLFKNH